MLEDPKVKEKKIPILFLSNKVDLPAAAPPLEVTLEKQAWKIFLGTNCMVQHKLVILIFFTNRYRI